MLNCSSVMGRADVVVIGGGFGGLTCALALAKAGRSVSVLEQGDVLGGAFQSFRRRGQLMDTGFHYVGGVGEGEVMRPLIRFFGLEDLPWQPLDDPFLDVFVRGHRYALHCGYDRFVETLAADFPDDGDGLRELVALMREINEHIYESVLPGTTVQSNSLMAVSAKTYLETHISNPELRDVLCGQCFTTELTDELPLYSFLQSLNSFIQGAYRLKGGGDVLISRLVEQIEALGGRIHTGKAVSRFDIGDDGDIRAVVCEDGSTFLADTFISTIHPALTTDLIPECPQVRGIYRRRMHRLENTVGMFTVQLALKPNAVLYRNRNISILESDDMWHAPCGKNDQVRNLLVHCNVPSGGDFATNIDLLTPMDWDSVREWEESKVGHRPDDYKAFKQRKAEECIALAKRYIPDLQGNIEHFWTSTPLTYRNYTSIPQGSSFGVRKSCNNLLGTVISPQTPFPNLFLAGQSLMLHGMLGTAMTSVKTCNLVCGRNLLR